MLKFLFLKAVEAVVSCIYLFLAQGQGICVGANVKYLLLLAGLLLGN